MAELGKGDLIEGGGMKVDGAIEESLRIQIWKSDCCACGKFFGDFEGALVRDDKYESEEMWKRLI